MLEVNSAAELSKTTCACLDVLCPDTPAAVGLAVIGNNLFADKAREQAERHAIFRGRIGTERDAEIRRQPQHAHGHMVGIKRDMVLKTIGLGNELNLAQITVAIGQRHGG